MTSTPDLVALRLNRGLSIRSAAKAMEIHEATLRRAESGDGGVHPSNAKKIADFYDLKVTDLIGEPERSAA